MSLSETQRTEFEIVAKAMMRFLNETCHPHVSVIITPTNAELLEGVCSTGEVMELRRRLNGRNRRSSRY